MNAAWDVVGIGENSVDEVYVLPGPVAPNVKAETRSRQVRFGGQVATTLCTCAAFGLRAAYVGTLGHDEAAARLRRVLEQRGVDLTHTRERPVPNRQALVLVDGTSGNRSVYWTRHAALTLRVDEIDAGLITRARLLHVDATHEEAAIAAARIARQARIPVTCDIDTVTEGTRRLLAEVSVPILAEQVPAALTGEHDLERALRIMRRSHGGLVCVTLGPSGAVLLDGDTLHRAPAPGVAAIDTTGAGDVFRGAFIHGLLRGAAPAEILRVANAAAALSCTREGAIEGVPGGRDVDAVLREGASGDGPERAAAGRQT